jgi:hypothetical protein
MVAFRWTAGFFVSLVFGGIVTQYYARRIRKLIGDEDPQYRILIPLSLGVVENLFFTIGVAFDLSGVMVGMVAWMGAKMAAHWGIESKEHQVKNIDTVRFLVLGGTMISLLFAMIGGLICAGKLWF